MRQNLVKMSSELYKVFVYGTLQRGEPNYHLLDACITGKEPGYAKFLGEGITKENYPLVVASCYNIPFLLDTTQSGQQVTGELFEVDSVMLEKLDDLESHPHLYVRREIDINPIDEGGAQTGETIKSWCYLLPQFLDKMLQCKPYLSRYRTADLPDKQYVASEEVETAQDLLSSLLSASDK